MGKVRQISVWNGKQDLGSFRREELVEQLKEGALLPSDYYTAKKEWPTGNVSRTLRAVRSFLLHRTDGAPACRISGMQINRRFRGPFGGQCQR